MSSSAPSSLVVGVVAARNLLAEDINGFSDPFVQILLLDHRGNPLPTAPIHKTSIQKKTLNPTWNETFVLGQDGLDLRVVTTLRFLVYDYDGFKRDDTLGVVDVPMDLLLTDEIIDKTSDTWYMVKKHEGEMTKDATGELQLTFTRPSVSKAATTASPAAAAAEPNLLYVTIDSGRDLLAMDKGQSSDPFVKLSLVGQKFHTATIEKTLKPHWDERFAFLLSDAHTTLELLAEDEDRTVNDFLGRAQIVLADVLVNGPHVEHKVMVKLLDKKLREDKDRGSLQLRLLWTYDENAESITTSMKKERKKTMQDGLMNQLKSSLHLGGGPPGAPIAVSSAHDEGHDYGQPWEDDEDDDGMLLQDESDGESEAGAADSLRFLVVTIHRLEELPPLDALTFDKEKHKPIAPGGGIDAYVAAWQSDRPEDFIRTRIHTRKGRREELSTSFHESLMLPLSAPTAGAKTNVTLAVMDWDQIGGDEVVSHIELQDVEQLVAQRGKQPFWWNMYGAPLVGLKNKEAVAKMNEDTLAGSTYRGRVLLTVKFQQKPKATYENKHQKRAAKKLPRSLFPLSQVYRLRAHFLSAIGMPVPHGKYYLSLSCGLNEITSSHKGAINHAIEWNETEESDRMLFPVDVTQIPDILLCLCTGEWEKRVIVGYKRFSAAELLKKEFNDTVGEWVTLTADPTTEAVDCDEFPGKVLVRLGFGTLESANAQVWDQKALIDQVSRRVPYQVRVRVQAIQAESGETLPSKFNLTVQCWDQEVQKNGVELTSTSKTPTTFCLDTNLPHLSVASQVLIHVKDATSKSSKLLGTAGIALGIAEDKANALVTLCTAEQLKTDKRLQLPVAGGLSLVTPDGSVTRVQVHASVELIRKTFPDEVLPSAEATP
ncbi:hypothetical protein Poli38472_006916 [Pythium oligandrum]|uniref:C2 domain-containing protein n=1 Tax=Pythium oligandrum TaxID=41045 RepID=A0A8K1FDV5_PYTOL|nr:hypothetical protein Poli38472_006916 [Pythium oligandrum]|eukprot:TMW58771.1 hypothetical protein Poli38472_006916 [Pythium oligandrum]